MSAMQSTPHGDEGAMREQLLEAAAHVREVQANLLASRTDVSNLAGELRDVRQQLADSEHRHDALRASLPPNFAALPSEVTSLRAQLASLDSLHRMERSRLEDETARVDAAMQVERDAAAKFERRYHREEKAAESMSRQHEENTTALIDRHLVEMQALRDALRDANAKIGVGGRRDGWGSQGRGTPSQASCGR
jgi:chromosome segregation ATPase